MVAEIGDKIFILSCDICEEDAPQMFKNIGTLAEHRKKYNWVRRTDMNGSYDVCLECQKREVDSDVERRHNHA